MASHLSLALSNQEPPFPKVRNLRIFGIPGTRRVQDYNALKNRRPRGLEGWLSKTTADDRNPASL